MGRIIKRKRVLRCIILGIMLFLACFLSGCFSPEEKSELNLSDFPQTIQLEIDSLERVDLEKENFQERMAVKYDSYYIPQIASVLASNKEGDLLGMMYDSGNMPYDALYCIDVGQQRADKVVRLTSGYIAASADLTEKWIVWVEKNQDGWKLYKCEHS